MDKIFIKGLKVDTIIGIYDLERTNRQRIVVDLEMAADIRTAASTEDITSTLNYKELCEKMEAFLLHSQYQLIETMAEELALMVMSEFGVSWLQLTIHKPDALSDVDDVGVVIERGVQN